jgi:hypothetical protein
MFIQFRAPGLVTDFDPMPLGANQTRLAQNFEMRRERGFGDNSVARSSQGRAVFRCFRITKMSVDGCPFRVRKRVKNCVRADVFDCWVV